MENEPVTADTLDFCHVLDHNISLGIILMRYSSPLQQCNVVTSRFVNQEQRLNKRGMSVHGSRLCCTRTEKCGLKSEGDRSLDRIAVLVIGCGQEKFSIVSDSTGGEAGPTCVDLVQEQHVRHSNTGIREPVSGKKRLL